MAVGADADVYTASIATGITVTTLSRRRCVDLSRDAGSGSAKPTVVLPGGRVQALG